MARTYRRRGGDAVTHYRLHLADEPMSWTQFATLSDAIDECRAIYGGGIVTEIGEDRTLVWSCEEDAEGDDGANAVADIRAVADDTARIDVPVAALDTLDAAIDIALDCWADQIRCDSEHYTDADMETMRLRIAQAKAMVGRIASARYEATRGNGEVIG